MSSLAAVNVGMPREICWRGEHVSTAIYKSPVEGRRRVGRLNVDGDGQADLVGHGGEHRAVFVYQLDSYRHWEAELGRADFAYGQFGENFTVEGLLDHEVCIGDRYAIGTALFEVTQPRVTCFKVGIRMDEPRMPALLTGHGRPGFYLRVLQAGDVGAGDPIRKVATGPGAMTVRETSALLYLPGHRRDQLERALAIPALSEGWRGSFREMLAQGDEDGNAGLGVPTPPPQWEGFRSFRVSAVREETPSVRSFTLVPVDGEPASWVAGQYISVRLLPDLVRSYSISRSPGSGELRISVRLDADGRASAHLHGSVRPGDVLEIAAPRGAFTLASAAPGRDLALLSAGIGVTPLLAMLGALAEDAGGRRVWWIHGARTPGEHALADEARALLAGVPDARSHVTYSRAGGGRVDAALLDELGLPRDAEYFLCGPEGFMRDLAAGLAKLGVDLARVHREAFGADRPAAGAAPPHPPPGEPGPGPAVMFARSGLSVPWASSYGTLLELAEACDVPVRWSCRTGVCRTCETGLVDGSVAYRPEPLEPAAPGHALLCCSRPAGAVTLDL